MLLISNQTATTNGKRSLRETDYVENWLLKLQRWFGKVLTDDEYGDYYDICKHFSEEQLCAVYEAGLRGTERRWKKGFPWPQEILEVLESLFGETEEQRKQRCEAIATKLAEQYKTLKHEGRFPEYKLKSYLLEGSRGGAHEKEPRQQSIDQTNAGLSAGLI